MSSLLRLWRFMLSTVLLLLSPLLLANCLHIDYIKQPQHAHGGQIISTTIVAYPNTDTTEPYKPYISLHLPQGWSVIQPLTYHGNYTGTLTYDPAASAEMEADYPKEGYYWWTGHGLAHAPITANLRATSTWRIQTVNQAGFYTLEYFTQSIIGAPESDFHRIIPIAITTNHGASWHPGERLTAYAQAGRTNPLKVPLNLVSLGVAGSNRFNLSANLPSGWTGNFVIKGVTTNNTGPMSLYQSLPIELQINLPANVPQGEYVFPIKATSTAQPLETALTSLKVVVFGPDGITPPRSSGLQLVGHIGGSRGRPFIQGNYAYIKDGSLALSIWDISNPASPFRVGQTNLLPDSITDFEVKGGYAYLALESSDLRVLDVSNPAQPLEVSLFPIEEGEEASEIAIWNHYIYLATSNKLYIIDVSYPSAPRKVGEINQEFDAIASNNGYLYAAPDGGDFLVFSLSNPAQPVEIGNYSGANSISTIVALGDYVYLNDSSETLITLDVSNPTTPKLIGTYSQPNIRDIAIQGNYAYLATGEDGLKIVSLAQPASPIEVGSYDKPGSTRAAAVAGPYAFVEFFGNGLEILNIASPSKPVAVSALLGGSNAYDVALASHYAYVAATSGLQIVDISSPTHPEIVSVFPIQGDLDTLDLEGNYVYLEIGASKIQVVDVSQPTAPRTVSFHEGSGYTTGNLEVSNRLAYIPPGLRIIDFSNLANPVEVSSFPEMWGDNLAVAGNHAYLASAFKGLQIVDVSNPSQPVRLGLYDWFNGRDSHAPAVAVAGRYAFLSTAGKGFHVVDISNPVKPVKVGSNEDIWGYYDLELSGPYAYLPNGQSVRAIDISQPSAPRQVAFSEVSGATTFGLDVAGKYIYVAGGSGGLLIFRHVADMKDLYLPLIEKK